MNVWDEMRVLATDDVAIIRKARAGRLTNPDRENHPDASQRPRAANEVALRQSLEGFSAGTIVVPSQEPVPAPVDRMDHGLVASSI